MKHAGFTLVEMLVAITLMALMGVVCWRGLVFVADSRAGIQGETLELGRMLHAFAQIERDVAERLPDIAAPARATTPELPLAMSVVPAPSGASLEILRVLPDAAGRAELLHIVYRIRAEGLVRATDHGEVLLLPGAARLQLRLNSGGFWTEPGASEPVRPFTRAAALEISLADAQGRRYVKVLAL